MISAPVVILVGGGFVVFLVGELTLTFGIFQAGRNVKYGMNPRHNESSLKWGLWIMAIGGVMFLIGGLIFLIQSVV